RLPAVRSSRFALRLGGLAVVLGLTLFGLRLSSEGHAYGLRLSACGWLVTWLVGDRRGSVLPTPQSLLRSVYAGRLCVAGAIYLAAALKFAVAAPLDLLVTSFVLVAAVVVTIASYWYTHVSRRTPGRTFLYGQALFDVALITTVVHITGGRADARVQGGSVARAAHHAGVREDRARVLGRDHGDRAAGRPGDARGSHRAASRSHLPDRRDDDDPRRRAGGRASHCGGVH